MYVINIYFLSLVIFLCFIDIWLVIDSARVCGSTLLFFDTSYIQCLKEIHMFDDRIFMWLKSDVHAKLITCKGVCGLCVRVCFRSHPFFCLIVNK